MRLSLCREKLQYLLISHNRAVDAKIEPHFPSRSIHRPAGGPVEDGELGIPRVPVLLVHAPPQLCPLVHHRLPPAHMVTRIPSDLDPELGTESTEPVDPDPGRRTEPQKNMNEFRKNQVTGKDSKHL
jgi:hypothetical protein